MHLSEGLLPASHAALWTAVAAPAVWVGARRAIELQRTGEPAERAMYSLAGVVLFAVTLFPIPVPFSGLTSHLCATPLLACLFGARAIWFPTFLGLLVQALFFAHGGITTLGANLVSLGLVGGAVAVGAARALTWARIPRWIAVGIACGVADLAVYVADAAILGSALAGEKSLGFWFVSILAAFAPVQGPLAVVEGVASGLFVRTLIARRSRLLTLGSTRPAAASLTLFALSLTLGLGLFSPPPLVAEMRGLDDAVFSETAATAGRSAQAVWQIGEWEGYLSWALSFALGVLAHRCWVVLKAPSAPPAVVPESTRGERFGAPTAR